MKTVFLSSTSKDLEAYRDAAIKVCMKLNLHPIAMEYFNAMPAGATAGSKQKLDEADFYVGFFAHRYGYIEDAADGRSVTEIEFDYAGERGLGRICFIVDPKFPWPEENIDHENNPKLEAFKSKVNKLIRGQFTSVDNFASQLTTALVEWQGAQQGRAGGTSAVLVTRPDKLREKPKVLFGRDGLLKDVRALLDKHEQVLLQGLGGMGKTALAATLADQWIADGKGNVLWLKTGSADVDALCEALVRPFDAQQAIASQIGDAKIDKLNDLLYSCGATLLVLDDCWSSKDLFALLKAVPSNMALLATARQRYPLPKIRDVDELAPADALALLAYHADLEFTSPPTNELTHPLHVMGRGQGGGDNSALALCDLLGYHAFAVEIAGKTLKAQDWMPADLLKQIENTPDKLTMPLEFSETGRENVAKLLEVSLNALDDATREVFLAFGAFFAPQTTPEMLQLYFDGASDSPRLEGEGLGVRVDTALNTLHLHGLVERLPATDESVTAHRIHDLAYSYARAQNSKTEHERALEMCLSYTKHYNEPSLLNFAALRPELDNLLGAASWAFENAQYAAVEQFAWNLCSGDGSQFLIYRSFYSEATRLLAQSAQSAGRAGSKRDQAAHLTNLGSAYYMLGQEGHAIKYYERVLEIARDIGDKHIESNSLSGLGIAYSDMGQVEQAIKYQEQALTISREIGDQHDEGKQLSSLGNAYRDMGQVEKAIYYLKQALTISREIGDKRGEGNRLGNLGLAYSDLGQMDTAIDYYQQGLTISREIGDRKMEGNQLGNLGNSYRDLGQAEQAIDYHQQALTIMQEIGDKRAEGMILGNIGNAYRDLGQVEQAMQYYEQAITISRAIGYRMGEANDLNNMGLVHEELKDCVSALQHFQQARGIYAASGAQPRVEMADRNIARVQAKLGGDGGISS